MKEGFLWDTGISNWDYLQLFTASMISVPLRIKISWHSYEMLIIQDGLRGSMLDSVPRSAPGSHSWLQFPVHPDFRRQRWWWLKGLGPYTHKGALDRVSGSAPGTTVGILRVNQWMGFSLTLSLCLSFSLSISPSRSFFYPQSLFFHPSIPSSLSQTNIILC